jgi:hypothetical protein
MNQKRVNKWSDMKLDIGAANQIQIFPNFLFPYFSIQHPDISRARSYGYTLTRFI